MDFGFSEEQTLLKQSAASFLEKECPSSLLRAVDREPSGYSPPLWKKMAELDWFGLVLPEEYGGVGFGFADFCILLEEMGRVLVPGPILPTLLVEYALIEEGSPEQKKDLLPRIASGDLIVTLAYDADESVNGRPKKVQAVLQGNFYVLSGVEPFIPYAGAAQMILVRAHDGDEPVWILVDRDAQGVELRALDTIGSEKFCQVSLRDVKVAKENSFARGEPGAALARRLSQRGAVAASMWMVGLAQWVVDKTVAYAKERTQFGRPIGAFQAIQHKLSNMAVACDSARFIAYQAAWSLSEGQSFEKEVSIAKRWVGESCQRICLDSHQVHGAIGFTEEYDLQRYTRCAKALDIAFGTPTVHKEVLAGLLEL